MFLAASTLLVLSGLLAGGVAPAVGLSHAPARVGTITLASAAPPGPVHAFVTWDGTNVSTATSDSSARSVNLASTITLRYIWSSAGLHTISDARLQMFYFGFALSTRDVLDENPQPANNGSFTMTWQAGTIAYLLEGTFRLTASLLDPAGNTMWSEDFFIHANAPFSLLAAIPIVLVLIAVYEVYGLLTSGREPPLSKPASRPPKSPPSGGKGAEPTPEEPK